VQLQSSAPARVTAPASSTPLSPTGLHASAAVLLVAVWWFYQQGIAGLQRKLLTVFLFPVRSCVARRVLCL
jgi:hypothetical protein